MSTYVRPYRRKDGTRVRGHMRRKPSPRIGAEAMLLVSALLMVLGYLMHPHSGSTELRQGGETISHSTVSPADSP